MPVHIYGAGGGGGAKNALSVYFTPTDAQSYTFTIDDVDFAKRFNDAKTTKHLDLFFDDGAILFSGQSGMVIYHVGKGIINGVDAQKLFVVAGTGLNFGEGDGSEVLWDGGFAISGNSATFTVTCVSGLGFYPNKKHRATWICEE